MADDIIEEEMRYVLEELKEAVIRDFLEHPELHGEIHTNATGLLDLYYDTIRLQSGLRKSRQYRAIIHDRVRTRPLPENGANFYTERIRAQLDRVIELFEQRISLYAERAGERYMQNLLNAEERVRMSQKPKTKPNPDRYKDRDPTPEEIEEGVRRHHENKFGQPPAKPSRNGY